MRLRGIMGGVVFVFIDAKAAAAALRLDVEGVEVVRARVMVSVAVLVVALLKGFVVDRVCRNGGDRSGDTFMLLFFIALEYGAP